jgi:hypothetical protein
MTITNLSSWVKPGDPLCQTCEGSGADPAGPGQCPECRGFGHGPGNPDGPEVPGGICTACGAPSRPGDPVIQEPNGRTHRSHILADIEHRKQIRGSR